MTLNPVYNETYTFSWNGVDKLMIEIFDKDELSKDDHMGKLEISLDPLLQDNAVVMRDWFTVRHRKHKQRKQGEIFLEMSFLRIE